MHSIIIFFYPCEFLECVRPFISIELLVIAMCAYLYNINTIISHYFCV